MIAQTAIDFECASLRFEYDPKEASAAHGPGEDDITLASIASIDRAMQIMQVASRWGGPVSVSFYARTEVETAALEAFSTDVLLPLSRGRGQPMSIEILSSCHDKRRDCSSAEDSTSQQARGLCNAAFEFPINKLRNSAVLSCCNMERCNAFCPR